MPDPVSDAALYELVKTYQVRHHSKPCKKYKNGKCWFHSGWFFTDRNIIACPLSIDLTSSKRKGILKKKNEILKVVSEYINEELNPGKHKIYDPSRENYIEPKSIKEILSLLDISEGRYYEALEISEDNDFQIHFRQSPNSYFINNYSKTGLEAWNANIDIQVILNEQKAMSYMYAYLSKSEETCSKAMKHALRESIEKKQGNYDKVCAVAHAYASNRECSVQEAVHHCLRELWLRKIFPSVIYANTNLAEKRLKMLQSQEEISQLPTR